MWNEAKRLLRTAVTLFLLLAFLTGLIYPVIITGIAEMLFYKKANGSLLWQEKKIIGSELIGQFFNTPNYFWGRPSATIPFPYNAANSSGSNLGPTNPYFIAIVKSRADYLRSMDPLQQIIIPVDLVTTSASGLDPEISPFAALYQVPRIAKARKISEVELKKLISQVTHLRTAGILGDPRVNVLQLNLKLDQLTRSHHV